ncbi:MAG: class I SAM-dependent methyltransferase [Polyangiaceae bacterium]|nr:class I SAM-dependent methyltransferase [Polyangiaceae bacterium]
MVAESTESDRIKREAEFHDRIASDIDVKDILVDETFTAPTAVENRFILDEFGDVRGKSILDYGCGSAEGGIYLAKLGARVVGVDVSEKMLESAQELAKQHGVSIETRLVKGESIPAQDGEFDLIYGNGVLHHAPLSSAIPELARVLKPEGKGCFIEPLPYNPVINVYRRMADKVRTVDEKPLHFRDLDRFRDHFKEVRHREFWLTTLSVFLKFYLVDRVHPNEERYWKKIYKDTSKFDWMFNPLRRFDDTLLSTFPALGRLCWNTVLTVAKPIRR